jgi:hypothetical protein
LCFFIKFASAPTLHNEGISELQGLTIVKDGTVQAFDGRTIFFPFQRFKDEICKKGHCFVCGAVPSKSFNSEHIFPNWMQKYCGIHNETLTLPTGNKVKYATYKISCCCACNSRLGEIYETPVSTAICDGYEGLVSYIDKGGDILLKAWLALIFLKVHLRDFQNRVSLDRRQDATMIGDEYELHELHHIHAFARAAIAGVEIDDQVFGTLVILQVDPSSKSVAFDYCDNLLGRGLLIQINDLALIYILDDCGATAAMLSEKHKRLPSTISPIQLREIYASYLAANMHIKEKPIFRTEFIGPSGRPQISVELPEFAIHDFQPTCFGSLFAGALGNLAEQVIIDGKTGDDALDLIATGRVSFLFDENGALKNTNK